jgi:hypothetical protein
MIPVPRPPEPPEFDARCRQRGLRWLRENPPETRKRVPSFWTAFGSHLAAASEHRCYWLAMSIPNGQVEHFVPQSKVTGTPDEHLIYEWRNYRWALDAINTSKGTADVLDPFEVEEGWFEISLPDLQLWVTPKTPSDRRQLAEFTIQRLKLNGDMAIRIRARIFDDFAELGRTLDSVQREAPLIAHAIQRALDQGIDYRRSASRA